jgi:hypothetical protein
VVFHCREHMQPCPLDLIIGHLQDLPVRIRPKPREGKPEG